MTGCQQDLVKRLKDQLNEKRKHALGKKWFLLSVSILGGFRWNFGKLMREHYRRNCSI